MASQLALEYVEKAMSLLPENFWRNEYQLTLKLYKERAEAELQSLSTHITKKQSSSLRKLSNKRKMCLIKSMYIIF